MAENKKISQLTQTINISGEELIPFVLDGQNKVVKAKYLKGADNLGEDFVDLVGDDGQEYRVKIVNGEAVAIRMDVFTKADAVEGENTQLFDGLIINQMYGGGDALTGVPVSHGFIELYNFREEEVNLKGLYLWYKAKAGTWQSLKLEGIIPARHSFLIRCSQHAVPFSQGVRCNIMNYDMQWNIKLSDKGFSCYLCIGDAVPEDNPVRNTKDAVTNKVNWTNPRYIDLLGAGGKGEGEEIAAYETRYLKCMDGNTAVRRIDFANSGAKIIGSNAKNKGFNDIDCQALDYKTCNVDIYRPRCVKDGRWTEFIDKPKQKETVPSMINVMFGENGDHTRTFTFQTPIAESGFVKIRKVGESKWDTYETNVEIFSNIDGDVTVHRCIVENLEFGEYEYQVGTEGCVSDNYALEVKEFNEEKGMRILWTTDQQSWTKKEYDAWQTVARYLNNKQQNLDVPFDFHLNTGDISQNANRRFEWSYYYDYAKDITRNIPHVITCGNNDLVNKEHSTAFNYYLTAQNQVWNSVYAFDLGFTHFVCLNSNQDTLYSGTFLQDQADWLDAHLTEVEKRPVQPRWVIIFVHLSPFTVERNKRLQCWVAPIEKHKVDMVLCGHNHAWSVSKPIYSGFDYSVNPAYNDYATVKDGTTELKIVDELDKDGNEINRAADKRNGTYYVLNQAAGFKLTGKQKPLNLAGKVEDKHTNGNGAPWWIEKQGSPKNPVFIDLQIDYDQIKCETFEVEGVWKYDEVGNEVINYDLNKVNEKSYHTLIINYSDRHPQE